MPRYIRPTKDLHLAPAETHARRTRRARRRGSYPWGVVIFSKERLGLAGVFSLSTTAVGFFAAAGIDGVVTAAFVAAIAAASVAGVFDLLPLTPRRSAWWFATLISLLAWVLLASAIGLWRLEALGELAFTARSVAAIVAAKPPNPAADEPAILAALVYVAIVAVPTWVMIASVRRLLDPGRPSERCPYCRYHLGELDVDRCPECGGALERVPT